jgi:hypothetical protein
MVRLRPGLVFQCDAGAEITRYISGRSRQPRSCARTGSGWFLVRA